MTRAASRFPIWPCTRWGLPCLRACAWSGGLLPHLFTLARRIAPPGGLFSVALSVGTPRGAAARAHPAAETTGCAASRPVVFGLSSAGTRPAASLRSSKTGDKVSPLRPPGKRREARPPRRPKFEEPKARRKSESRNPESEKIAPSRRRRGDEAGGSLGRRHSVGKGGHARPLLQAGVLHRRFPTGSEEPSGPSPRGWGKLTDFSSVGNLTRAIPTGVGKTES